ncbi:MAG: rod shape-determining protein MreD [Ignavibacteriae bacterium]|nr:rod shape-determining protein MreD [Ignavibacteriota bacterium]
MLHVVKYIIVLFLLIVIQTQIVRLVSLHGITPDLLIIWIVYIGLKEGQIKATLWGFGIGLATDLVTGNFIGLTALTKTASGFVAGYFYNENKVQLTLSSYRFILIVLIVSLVHNTLYFIIFTRGSEIGLFQAVFTVGLAATLYTAMISLLPMVAFSRKYRR